ncbi:Rho-binding antiterminator [Pseudoalteromonas luteoviolacea]|uniref:Rho-binding antiterminator n=1 Tax=Pseudoalteromonas luteoviolacea DSM 6061 TaxID=1365250 RepID=A0A166W599_9GAMM|nr:Rho-binding antiterminator [Pseudoalteromonas luteoviolacea]KZN35742.1 hypothetical protein N475_18055 [Pseudoalteromonas luteoviolacea DSM 6061]KZN54295.1 hypothetical protein N474_18265 [Pseudoalteromonas luteoviolacea CPMOR-2]MBE0389201.1 hypothetical protein [Pseudoalteromonas luteoviolacea DSM 6061]TQF68072.1 hypothetical protein FLM44_23170 [Pseudoalteromonas luteoviolacea]
MRCEHTDYLELACIKGFVLEVMTRENKSISGQAKDIVYNDQRQQCLVLNHNEQQTFILLDDISKLTALTPNSYFTTLILSD